MCGGGWWGWGLGGGLRAEIREKRRGEGSQLSPAPSPRPPPGPRRPSRPSPGSGETGAGPRGAGLTFRRQRHALLDRRARPQPRLPSSRPPPRTEGCGQPASGRRSPPAAATPGQPEKGKWKRGRAVRAAGRGGAGGAGAHSPGPPGGCARVRAGLGVTSPAPGRLLLPASRRAGPLDCPPAGPPALPGPRSPSRPRGDANSAPALPAPPRCGQGAGKGRGKGTPLPTHPPFRKVLIKLQASQGPSTNEAAGPLRSAREAASASSTVKWGQAQLPSGAETKVLMVNDRFLVRLESSGPPLSLSSIRDQICPTHSYTLSSRTAPGTWQSLNNCAE